MAAGLKRRTASLLLLAGDLVEDALHEDDTDADVLGHVGQKFGDEVVGGVGGKASGDALNGRGRVRMNARNILVAQLGTDGIAEQVGVVGHQAAVVVVGDEGAADGVANSSRNASLGHTEVTRILMRDRRDEERAEELSRRILQKTDAGIFAEAFEARPVGGVGVDGDREAGERNDS